MIIRKNVAAVIVNTKGLILVGQRRDLSGQWQLPQGGIDAGEKPEETVLREVEEETGIGREHLFIMKSTGPLLYMLPPEIVADSSFDGQEQTYFLIRFKGDDKEPSPSEEFSSFEWCSKEEVVKRAVYFKRKCYIEAFEQLFGDTVK
jgi:putative (di)nucleoside polyphosphate hydrolase